MNAPKAHRAQRVTIAVAVNMAEAFSVTPHGEHTAYVKRMARSHGMSVATI